MGGGSERVVERTAPSAPMATIPSQFSGYATQVGQKAQQFVDDPRVNLQQFLSPSPYLFSVPGMSPLQQLATQQAGERSFFGIPTPMGEQVAFQRAAGLPWMAGQQVPLSPFNFAGLGTAQQAAAIGQQPVDRTALERFATGSLGDTPAVRAAEAELQSRVLPRVQNQMALSGLASSGQLPVEVGRAITAGLAPVYQTGMQMQGQAAQMLAQGRAGDIDRQIQSLTSLRDTQTALGQTEQALQTDSQIRGLQAGLGTLPELRQLGAQEGERGIQGLREASTFGQLQRDVEAQQREQAVREYERVFNLIGGYVNPQGNFNILSTPGPSQVTRQTTPSGFSMFKIIPWFALIQTVLGI